MQSKSQRAVGAESRQTEPQDRRGRKQFCESQLWGRDCCASQEGREQGGGGGAGGRPTALGTLTGDSPSTRGPSLTRMAPLRPLRSSETLVQVSRATGSLLLVRRGYHEQALGPARPSTQGPAGTLPSVPGLSPRRTREGTPDDGSPLAQVIAELQEAVLQRQGHKVPLAVCLLPVVEEQTAGAACQEHHFQSHLLPGVRERQAGASQWPFTLQARQGLGEFLPSSSPLSY